MAGDKKEGVEEIRFSIENLLSADNLMDNDSVTVLQDKLNKYVYYQIVNNTIRSAKGRRARISTGD